MLLQQCSNTVLYHRRFGHLSALFPSMSQCKLLSTENSSMEVFHSPSQQKENLPALFNKTSITAR